MTAPVCGSLSVLFLISGLFSVLSMIYVMGRKGEGRQKAVLFHRISGWIFTVLFAVIFGGMLLRVRQNFRPLDFQTNLHIALALALVGLICIKALIPRLAPRLSSHMFNLGLGVFTLSSVMVGTVGYPGVIKMTRDQPAIRAITLDRRLADPDLGRRVFVDKCPACHALREIARPRPGAEWETIMNRMLDLAAPRITPEESEATLAFVLENFLPISRADSAEPIEKHCLVCHQSSEIFGTSRTRDDWRTIVQRMNELSPEHVPASQVNLLVNRLAPDLPDMPRDQPGAFTLLEQPAGR